MLGTHYFNYREPRNEKKNCVDLLFLVKIVKKCNTTGIISLRLPEKYQIHFSKV